MRLVGRAAKGVCRRHYFRSMSKKKPRALSMASILWRGNPIRRPAELGEEGGCGGLQ